MTSGDGDNADGGDDDRKVISWGSLELVAPAIQVRRAVPPLPETSMMKRCDGHWHTVPLD